MGNTSSSAANRNPSPSSARPRSSTAPASPSPTPDAHPRPPRPHPSLRTKKKSLELPDLASLAITAGSSTSPTSHASYRRPQGSDPIAIPARPGGAPPPGSPRLRALPSTSDALALRALPAGADGHALVDALALAPPPAGRGTPNPHMRGAPLQYSSTRSFGRATHAAAGTAPQQQQQVPSRPPPMQSMQSLAARSTFVAEDVRSTIPLALRKAEATDADAAADAPVEEKEGEREPASVCIVWRGPGKSVALMRAADLWKERKEMDYDEATQTWSTWVTLMPGTHHIRFVVDGVVVCAEDLPTAVDDNGSLANYVAVPISGHTPPSATLHPSTRSTLPLQAAAAAAAPAAPPATTLDAFWADADEDAGTAWTDQPPWPLACAAEEEEAWLAHGQQARSLPPQHPQAPSLPRHLEKLILNHRPPGMSRGHAHSSHHLGASARVLAMTPASGPAADDAGALRGALPVTTASGTNILPPSAPRIAGAASGTPAAAYTKLDSQGLADDGSVLPVPSHVVLQHLGTSAIRNGVLAVSSTNRYKRKYMTTIYYKPT